jgi:RND family efflux transporter MFP subunit
MCWLDVMNKAVKLLLPLLIVAVSLGIAVVMTMVRPEAKLDPPALPSLLVDVGVIERRDVTFSVRSQGSVSPRTQTTLVAEAQGQIIDVSPAFVSGGFFRKGDVLIRIDPRNYEANVKRARANVARAVTQLETESALAGYAAQDYERLRRVNPDQGPASGLALRKPQMKQALAELHSTEADLDKALGDLDRTVIRAPYDGMVRNKVADVGQYVSPGTTLGVTFAVDIAEVRLPVTQNDLQYLDLDQLRADVPIAVRLEANFGGDTVTRLGTINRSEGVFDTSSRVLYLVAEIEDPYGLNDDEQIPLIMGTFVAAEIGGQAAGKLAVVPRYALQRGGTLWLIDDQLRIFPRQVEVVRRDEDFVYIAEGVENGERYCLTPIDQPLPGMQVRLGRAS